MAQIAHPQMKIDTAYYDRCIRALEKALGLLLKAEPDSIDHDIYRSACVKEFEIILEQSGKLLRKVLTPYLHSNKEADRLYFKDIFREGVKRSLISTETCERWLQYRDNRNTTAHDYGAHFAEETLAILPQFVADAKELSAMITQQNHAAEG